MKREMNVFEIFQTIRKRISTVLLITILFTVIGGGVSIFLNKKFYESTSTLTFGVEDTRDTEEVNQITGEPIQEKYIKFGTHSVYNESFQFYKELLRSTELLEEVIATLDLDMTNKELEDSISLKNPEGSGTLLLAVQSEKYKNTDEIADEVVTVFEKKNLEITELDNIKIINTATEPKIISTQNNILNIMLSAAVGLVISIVVIIILEYFENNKMVK